MIIFNLIQVMGFLFFLGQKYLLSEERYGIIIKFKNYGNLYTQQTTR